MVAIHQFVPCAEAGAVGDHLVQMQRLIREDLGLLSEVFSPDIRDGFPGQALSLECHASMAEPDDRAIYHHAIGSDVVEYLLKRPEPLAIYYHNLTPLRYLRPWDPAATYGVEWGLRQHHQLVHRADWAVAPSSFSAHELRELGYAHVSKIPLLIDLEGLAATTDEAHEASLGRGKGSESSDWLFIGRFAANKCQHRVVAAFAAYRHLYDPGARLRLVGPPASEPYVAALGKQIHDLGLGGIVTLIGRVTSRQLTAHYRQADVFVCLSEHEGFCVPVLEAMWHSVPVIALAAAAVPETVGPAGVLLPFDGRSQPVAASVAAAVHLALDRDRRACLQAAGRARARGLALDRVRPVMAAALREWIHS